MSARPFGERYEEWRRLASDALRLALERDWPASLDMTQRLSDEFGADGLAQGVLAWIDTALSRAAYDGDGVAIRLRFLDVDTGVESDSDNVTPALRWAGRLLSARAAGDEDAYRALYRSLAGAQFSEGVGAVLNACSTTILTGRGAA